MRFNPARPGSRSNLANLLAGRGETDAAIEQLEAALETKPQSREIQFNIQFNLATLLARRLRFDAAIPHYEKALEIAPNYAAAKDGLARARAGVAEK